MWHELIEELDLDVGDGPDLAGSIFVGDAGGRQATNGGKGDHSCSDRCVTYSFDHMRYCIVVEDADYKAGTSLSMLESTSRPLKSISSSNLHNLIHGVSVLGHILALRRLAPQTQVQQV